MKKIKHNYTSELELKSLLIRIKNKRLGIGSPKMNNIITKYIKYHTAIGEKKYAEPTKRNKVRAKLKLRIIELSECTCADDVSYEKFGKIVLLMIKNILRKPQFSGYTYSDDFYSDSVYKILKYLNNFNHLLISERTNTAVNAFAYISQIMHNSILYILNMKKKESAKLAEYAELLHVSNDISDKDMSWWIEEYHTRPASQTKITKMFDLKPNDLIAQIKCLNDTHSAHNVTLELFYPYAYEPTFKEYQAFKIFQNENIIVRRMDEDDDE